MVRADNIKDLHGNTYKLRRYTFYLEFPKFEGITVYKHVFTRDVLTGTRMNILETDKGFYAVFHLNKLDLYVVYRMKHISYNILEDLRHSHLYGNKYHS